MSNLIYGTLQPVLDMSLECSNSIAPPCGKLKPNVAGSEYLTLHVVQVMSMTVDGPLRLQIEKLCLDHLGLKSANC